MARGRRPKGAALVDGLSGSDHAKERLKAILETLSGERSIAEACAQLGIGETAFRQLRQRTLQDAAQSLEPRSPGRPRQEPTPEQVRVREMEDEVFHLKKDLQAARLREEIALTMPHLLKERTAGNQTDAANKAPPTGKKTSREIRKARKRQRRKRRSQK